MFTARKKAATSRRAQVDYHVDFQFSHSFLRLTHVIHMTSGQFRLVGGGGAKKGKSAALGLDGSFAKSENIHLSTS